MYDKLGSRLMILGLLLMMVAMCLTGYNIWDMERAATSSDQIVAQLETVISVPKPSLQVFEQNQTVDPVSATTPLNAEIPDYVLAPEMEMPETVVDGVAYIGMLEIPSLDLTLPIASSWSYPLLKNSPCRYAGSAYTNDLVIAAHNYTRHFGNLRKLYMDSEIRFTDANGNVFQYTVVEFETLSATSIDDMTSDTRGLTLFTCTVGGQSRIVVRAERVLE